MKKFISLIIIFILYTTAIKTDEESLAMDNLLQEHINKLSDNAYNDYFVEAGGKEGECRAGSMNESWDKITENVFQKLIQFSGEAPIPICFVIVDDPSFNAGAFPNGKFIIYKGVFNKIDEKVKLGFFSFIKNIKEDREGYLAAVLSHELAHFYQRHKFNSLKKLLQTNAEAKATEIIKLELSREDELQADKTGILYMARAGYRVGYFRQMLDIIIAQYVESKKNSDDKNYEKNLYFSTHPSPHERINKISKDESKLHKWAFDLETAFSNIQLSKELENAENTLNRALLEDQRNPTFLKALAVCKHKKWLNTAKSEDLQLKSIIDIASYKENASTLSSKKEVSEDFPGNSSLYYQAVEAYEDIDDKMDDASFLSNYAVLLAYDPAQKNTAIDYAINANIRNPNIQTTNNLGLVYYIANKEELAIRIFEPMALQLDARLRAKINSSIIDPESVHKWKDSIARVQIMDRNYVYEDFTPIINYLLIKQKNESLVLRNFVEYYLNHYDRDSEWSKYLAFQYKVKIEPIVSKNDFIISGLKLGEDILSLQKKWGNPEWKSVEDKGEIWTYDKKGIRVILQNAKIIEIHIQSDKGFGIQKSITGEIVKIGAERLVAEKILGSKSMQKAGNRFLYSENGNASVRYIADKIQEIILFKE